MKSFKEYLPESFLVELAEGPSDSQSPINGAEADKKPNPAETVGGTRELNIGDPVIVKKGKRLKYEGCTGDVADFGKDKHFVVVDLYNYGKHSFHQSDVEYNDYADDEETDHRRELENLRIMSGYK